jgi:hypothetical protein
VRTALTPFVKEMETLLEGVRECRAGSQTPTWNHKVTAADLARAVTEGFSIIDPSPEALGYGSVTFTRTQ